MNGFELPPINAESLVIFLAIAIGQVATFGTTILAYLQNRKNSKKLDVAKDTALVTAEKTSKIQSSVNGHLDALMRELNDVKAENERLKLAQPKTDRPAHLV
jgi:uncharacterized membrane protein